MFVCRELLARAQVVDFGLQDGVYGCSFYVVLYHYLKDGLVIFLQDNLKADILKVLLRQLLSNELKVILT